MYGMLWSRDKESESFDLTLEKGYKYYIDKYSEEPSYIECSALDKDTEFQYKNAKVVPHKLCTKGTLWITSKKFENKSKPEKIYDIE